MAFTVGLAQCKHPEDRNVPALVESFAQRAVEASVDLLVFPESLMTSYEKERGAFLDEAEPLGGKFTEAIDAIAKKYGLWMVYTVNEKNPGGNPFNTAVIVGPDGSRAASYRKVHLFDTDFTHESDRMSKGDQLFTPVDLPFAKIGLAICYDLRFPEVARNAALQGCQLMLYPAAWVSGDLKIHHWKTLLAARAIENEMFVAGVSRVDKGYIGTSCIFDPKGVELACGGDQEELVIAKIDTDAIEDVRYRMPVFKHRQPELYIK